MKLYKLSKNRDYPNIDKLWGDQWDICEGFVICAETGPDARQIAADQSTGCEIKSVWLNAEYVTCEWIGQARDDMQPGILLTSFKAG